MHESKKLCYLSCLSVMRAKKKKKAKISLLEQISLFELIWHTCLEWGRAHDIHPDNCVAAYNRVDKIQNIPKKANFFHQLYFLSPDIQTLFSHLCMHFAQLTIHAYNHGLFKTIYNYTFVISGFDHEILTYENPASTTLWSHC